MIKILTIIGKSASGKDTILKELKNLVAEIDIFNKFNFVIKNTTRPKRDNEVDGVDYHFITDDEFTDKLLNKNEMVAATSFNNWGYGICKNDLKEDKINVVILSPEELSCFFDTYDIDIKVIYVKATDKIRLIRSLKREENPDINEIWRRYETDNKQFLYYEDDIISNIGEENIYNISTSDNDSKDKIFNILNWLMLFNWF